MTELLNNREYRQKLLKQIIKDLHAVTALKTSRNAFKSCSSMWGLLKFRKWSKN